MSTLSHPRDRINHLGRDGQRLHDLMRLAHIRRWSVIETDRPQSVAVHSFNTAVLGATLWDALGLDRNDPLFGRLLYRCLTHDAPEAATGDIPSHVKGMLGRELVKRVERQLCPWVGDEPPCEPLVEALLALSDKIEALHFVGLHCHNGSRAHLLDELRGQVERHSRTVDGLLNMAEGTVMRVVNSLLTPGGQRDEW
jgi:hypothetical protein